MGVECLSPNSSPKLGKEAASGPLTWEVSADAQLPWLDPSKSGELKALIAAKAKSQRRPLAAYTIQYTVFCGLIPVPLVVEIIREKFGVDEVKDRQRREEPVPTFAVTVDAEGYVSADPFVSSLPWAVSQVLLTKPNRRLDFTGFFGRSQVHEVMLTELDRAMERLLLIKAADDNEEAGEEVSSEGDLKRLDLAAVITLCNEIYAKFGWLPAIPLNSVRVQASALLTKTSDKESSSTDLLNSFFVEDLGMIREEIKRKNYGAALDTFMTGELRADRKDIRSKTDTTVGDTVVPGRMPLGSWPAEHGLVRAQQFAVNTIMDRLSHSSGIFSVNGPPGTGKTTLLRDIVAAVVVERANAMCAFAEPLDAFQTEVKVEGWKYGQVWALDESLCNSGIVVASANNGAVENVTKELPAIKAVPKNSTLRYLASVSDSIEAPAGATKRKPGTTWGLIAGVMGNKSNRRAFFDRLRWSSNSKSADEEFPMASLWDVIEAKDYEPIAWPIAVSEYRIARNKASAARGKMQATCVEIEGKRSYVEAVARCQALEIQQAEKLARASQQATLTRTLAERVVAEYRGAKLKADALKLWQQSSARAKEKNKEFELDGYQLLDDELEKVGAQLKSAADTKQVHERLLAATQHRKPGLLARLFTLGKKAAQWEQELRDEESALRRATRELRDAEKSVSGIKDLMKKKDRLSAELRQLDLALEAATEQCHRLGISQPSTEVIEEARLAELEQKSREMLAAASAWEQQMGEDDAAYQRIIEELDESRSSLAEIQRSLESKGVTAEMEQKWLGIGLSEDEIQLASPWFYKDLFDARQELFCRAMELHESFIAHSWQKIKNNLAALDSLHKGGISISGVKGGVSQLWDSLFMVVPVVSTTFASFPRMFEGWGRESIGWLLIDEAGQATPQAAMGAIWRAQRVVVVGDPWQLEPVVSLPPEILEPLLDRCGARRVYDPSKSSVQVLADMGNDLGTDIVSPEETRWVGSPLRVHRRCLDPMFSVSNEIAYGNMMVYGAGKDEDDLWFGESCWIDVPALNRSGNNVPAQVSVAAEMAAQFERHYALKSDGKFNLYVITPFRDVKHALGDALGSRLSSLSDVKKMHGTVHTFQGKEADVVIFVLGGAPGSISQFAAAKPNLLNVALTRAKKRIYVIGDSKDWADAPFFSKLYRNSKIQRVNSAPPIIFPRSPSLAESAVP